ncbi:hypothetical protein KQI84_02895 [bacterium]|nr:hypothetical protein [bacterium]
MPKSSKSLNDPIPPRAPRLQPSFTGEDYDRLLRIWQGYLPTRYLKREADVLNVAILEWMQIHRELGAIMITDVLRILGEEPKTVRPGTTEKRIQVTLSEENYEELIFLANQYTFRGVPDAMLARLIINEWLDIRELSLEPVEDLIEKIGDGLRKRRKS